MNAKNVHMKRAKNYILTTEEFMKKHKKTWV